MFKFNAIITIVENKIKYSRVSLFHVYTAMDINPSKLSLNLYMNVPSSHSISFLWQSFRLIKPFIYLNAQIPKLIE